MPSLHLNFLPEAGASSFQKLGLLHSRSWCFFLPTSISSSPFNSSISIHVILNLHPPSSFACAYDPDRMFSLPPLPSFTSNHRIAFLPPLSPPPRSTPQLSHGSPPDLLHKPKGTYDIPPLFGGTFWLMGHQCLKYQIRTVLSGVDVPCVLCPIPWHRYLNSFYSSTIEKE